MILDWHEIWVQTNSFEFRTKNLDQLIYLKDIKGLPPPQPPTHTSRYLYENVRIASKDLQTLSVNDNSIFDNWSENINFSNFWKFLVFWVGS